jgi:hypothetical protein
MHDHGTPRPRGLCPSSRRYVWLRTLTRFSTAHQLSCRTKMAGGSHVSCTHGFRIRQSLRTTQVHVAGYLPRGTLIVSSVFVRVGLKVAEHSQTEYCSRLIRLNPSSVGAIASMNCVGVRYLPVSLISPPRRPEARFLPSTSSVANLSKVFLHRVNSLSAG